MGWGWSLYVVHYTTLPTLQYLPQWQVWSTELAFLLQTLHVFLSLILQLSKIARLALQSTPQWIYYHNRCDHNRYHNHHLWLLFKATTISSNKPNDRQHNTPYAYPLFNFIRYIQCARCAFAAGWKTPAWSISFFKAVISSRNLDANARTPNTTFSL